MTDDIRFSNFTYNPQTYYFFYIGDIKAYGLNEFLKEMFSRRLKRNVECISIVPDLLSQYNYTNVIVINSQVSVCHKDCEKNVSYRLDGASFMEAVSANQSIRKLISTILTKQDTLYINLYESKPEMTLDDMDGVQIIGPKKELAHRFNNKVNQYEMLSGHIPVIDFRLCKGIHALLQTTDRLRSKWADGIFVTRAYSAAGAGSAVTQNQKEVESQFGQCPENEKFLISPYLPHIYDPTVLGVVANADDVYIAGVADQRIEGGNRFVGSTFPSVLPDDQIEKLKEYTRIAGRRIGKDGYRGIFGCDYLIDRENNIHFLEINARKQGTTLEFCHTLKQVLPEGAPMIPELEYSAVNEGKFPENTVEPGKNSNTLHWGTYNYKLRKQYQTTGYIPQNSHEDEMFQKVATGQLFKDYAILEHIGSEYTVLSGTFLARVISVAKNPQDVQEGLSLGIQCIELTLDSRLP